MESSDGIRNQSGDADPLLGFVEETLDQYAAPQNSAHSSETMAPVDQDLVAVLRSRITDAESIIQKTQETIAALHSRVETLVCSVADLDKRLDRERRSARVRRVLPAALPNWPRLLALGTATVMAMLTIALVALLSRIAPLPSSATPARAAAITDGAVLDPPPEQRPATTTPPESAPAPRQPDTAQPQRVRAKFVASRERDAQPRDAPARDAPARDAPARDAPARDAPASTTTAPARTGQYVGTLSIDSDPSGEAFVNRRRVGRTPVTIADLKAGSHLIWIEREGYRRWTRVVEVPANRISRVSTALEPVVR